MADPTRRTPSGGVLGSSILGKRPRGENNTNDERSQESKKTKTTQGDYGDDLTQIKFDMTIGPDNIIEIMEELFDMNVPETKNNSVINVIDQKIEQLQQEKQRIEHDFNNIDKQLILMELLRDRIANLPQDSRELEIRNTLPLTHGKGSRVRSFLYDELLSILKAELKERKNIPDGFTDASLREEIREIEKILGRDFNPTQIRF